MKISICLPVMRRFRFLEQAICSILMQSHQDWQLVLKDGCPEDPVGSNERIKQLFQLVGAERLRYECSKDAGIFHAFNEALGCSTGNICYAMCSDDLLCPGALDTVNEAFEAERFPSTLWVYGKTVSADEAGRRLGIDGAPTSREAMLRRNRLGLPAVFWGRGLLGLTGLFDTRYRYSADYELYLRCWRHRDPLFIDQELGMFRHHAVNASQTHEMELEREVAKIRERHRCLGDVIQSARNVTEARKAYGGEFPIEECR